MAELSTKQRKNLSASKFALPAERAYPIPDKSHAANAKARASQMFQAGKMTEANYKKVNAAANKVLKRKGS